MLVNIAQWRPEISIFNARLDAEHLSITAVSAPPFLLGGTIFSPKFWKVGDQKKMSAWGVLKSLSHRYLLEGGAYYVSCQKRLYKMKYDFKGSIFKCQIWPALAKQPINV